MPVVENLLLGVQQAIYEQKAKNKNKKQKQNLWKRQITFDCSVAIPLTTLLSWWAKSWKL